MTIKYLIPPSEGKNIENLSHKKFKNVFDNLSFLELNNKRKELIDFLSSMNFDDKNLKKLTGLKGKNLEEAFEINKKLMHSKVKNSIELFDGVMFKSIDYNGMDNDSKKFFEDNFAIFNALLGVNKPLDLIPEFKVKPEGYIKNKKIHKFWKESMKNIFENFIVFDLLTTNYRKMIDNKNFYKIDFYTFKNNEVKSAGHFSKKYRGEFINHVCKNTIDNLDTILNINTKNIELYKYIEETKEIKFIIKN